MLSTAVAHGVEAIVDEAGVGEDEDEDEDEDVKERSHWHINAPVRPPTQSQWWFLFLFLKLLDHAVTLDACRRLEYHLLIILYHTFKIRSDLTWSNV